MNGNGKPLDIGQKFGMLFVLLLVFYPRIAGPGEARGAVKTISISPPGSLSAKDRVEIFEKVWGLINEKYYDPKFNGVNWNDVRGRYRPLIEASVNDGDFFALIEKMVGELRDAHTWFHPPSRFQPPGWGVGVFVGEREGEVVVEGVVETSEADRGGVKRGMVVRTIDGRPVAERVAEVSRQVAFASSERYTKILIYSRLLRGVEGSVVRLGLERYDGASFEIALTRRRITAPTPPDTIITSDGHYFIARVLPSGYLYLDFDGFYSGLANRFKEALIKHRNAPGIIINLAGNGGGDGFEGAKVADYILNRKILVMRQITRSGKPLAVYGGLRHFPSEIYVGNPEKQIYTGPIVILINEGTASASELFAIGMQEAGRATIIGRQSCGCAITTISTRKIKGGGMLSISEVGHVTPKGYIVEGKGVTPDKIFPATIANLRRKGRPILEEAESYLNNLPKK